MRHHLQGLQRIYQARWHQTYMRIDQIAQRACMGHCTRTTRREFLASVGFLHARPHPLSYGPVLRIAAHSERDRECT